MLAGSPGQATPIRIGRFLAAQRRQSLVQQMNAAPVSAGRKAWLAAQAYAVLRQRRRSLFANACHLGL